MKTILLTGSNGFTGKYIKALFQKKGYSIKGIVLHNPGKDDISCDLTNKTHVKELVSDIRPSGIIHLAAQSFVAYDNDLDFYKVNVLSATNILQSLDEANIQPEKIIIASSANIYGSPKTDIITEDTCPAPVNHYAASKLAMEHMVKTWFKRYPIIITRPFNYTGLGQDEKFLVPKIVNHYKAKETVIQLGNLNVTRNFSDVRDIARAYYMLYVSDIDSEIFNLSSNSVYGLKQIIEIMNKIARYKISVEVNPDFVRKNEIKLLNGSNKKISDLLGFKPEFTIEDTLMDMYRHSS